MLRCASGDSVLDASTSPISSCSTRGPRGSRFIGFAEYPPGPEGEPDRAVVGEPRILLGKAALQPREIQRGGFARGRLAFPAPHEHDEVAERVVQPGLLFDHALEHHGIRPGVQEAAHAATVLSAPAKHGLGVEVRIGDEVQARNREPPVFRRIEVRQVVAIADRAAALDLGVDAAEAEHEAHEADRGKDVGEIPEESQPDERSAQQQQVGRDEDRVDVIVRLAAEEHEGRQRDEQGGDEVLEPGRWHFDRAAADQGLGRFGEDLHAGHDRIDRSRLGIVEARRRIADEYDATVERSRCLRVAAANRSAFDEQVGGADPRQSRVLAPVGAHGCSELLWLSAGRGRRKPERHGLQGPVSDPLVERHVAQDSILVARDVDDRAVGRHRRAIRQQQSDLRVRLRIRHERKCGRRRGRAQRRAFVVIRVHASGREYETPFAARGHRIERQVPAGIVMRGIGQQDVVADDAHALAIEDVEQVRVPLAAPRPAAFALRAEMLDGALVDLDDDDAARGMRLDRPPLHDLVEDRVLRGIERSLVRPVPGEPGEGGEREQGIEGELEPERDPRERPAVAALDPGPGAHESCAEGGEHCVEPGEHHLPRDSSVRTGRVRPSICPT